ncbi:uncharacterized protein LOC143149702 [Ptiloglossa arizonensis]|uniref:uncharacterized protein LOC143149702 n=1 Tax=Ptiloglossa arizonensis TaxID=3350558 RepID=UPI003F9FECB7
MLLLRLCSLPAEVKRYSLCVLPYSYGQHGHTPDGSRRHPKTAVATILRKIKKNERKKKTKKKPVKIAGLSSHAFPITARGTIDTGSTFSSRRSSAIYQGFYAAAPQLDLNFVLQSCKAFENEGSNRDAGSEGESGGASLPRSLPNYYAQARVRNTYAKGSFDDCFRKPFGCPKCGRCFTQANLQRDVAHQNQAHRPEGLRGASQVRELNTARPSQHSALDPSSRLLYGSCYSVDLYRKTRRLEASEVVFRPRRRRYRRKDHVCPKCGNGYTVAKSLKRHLRYECGVAPRFKCPYCDVKRIKIEADLENLCSVVMEEAKDFDYEEEKPLSSRRRRTGTLRDIERHTCSRCSKSYIHAWHLKRHTKFECGQEPKVQCPYCAARMKQRGHVYRHIRQCHRGQNVYVIDLN